jgi:hypothetical protein
LLHVDLYRSDTATILRYYQHRIPILLDQLAIRIDVSSHVYVKIRQCLLSLSPAGQPLIDVFA